MNLTKILTIVLFLASIGLGAYLFFSIRSTITEREAIAGTEQQVIEKLSVIREAEKAYLEQYGEYTANWDSLKHFIETGIVPITVRKETIIPLSYGKDSIQVRIDTIDRVPAKERIFKKTHAINAAEDGIFLGFMVENGAQVVKGQKSYRMKKASREKVDEYVFLDAGTVSSIAPVKEGDQIDKGDNLITFWNYQLNPNTDIKTLNIAPGSNKEFQISVDKIDRNGILVDVIHVMDPDPVNPARKTTNEAKNRQPLQFGSKNDVSTAGNWE